jgi:hypothetical protein
MAVVHKRLIRLLTTVVVAGLGGWPTTAVKAGGENTERSRPANGARSFRPQSIADYGSGASIHTEWYAPGGLGGGIGVFVGHPNTLARADRALLRFNLSPLFLMPEEAISHQSAVLRFSVSVLAGRADQRRIEIVDLSYDPWSLAGNDLVNAKAQVVATVVVKRKEYPGRVYSIDATKWVQETLRQGNKFCAFRFRDVGAESHGNPDLAPSGVTILFNAATPELEVKEMK